MKFCLVTDRRRLGQAIGAPAEQWIAALHDQVEAAAHAGIDYVQVRENDLDARDLVVLVRSLLGLLRTTSTQLLVNDRVDVAIATNAAGVHLKEQSLLPEAVRRMAPAGFVIGCSIHTTAAIPARRAADFFVAGTVMPTASKRAPDYLNEDGLRQIVEAAAGQPVLGIGGLDERSIPILASSGAAGLAAIGAFIPAGGEHVSDFVQKRVRNMRFALDHAARRP